MKERRSSLRLIHLSVCLSVCISWALHGRTLLRFVILDSELPLACHRQLCDSISSWSSTVLPSLCGSLWSTPMVTYTRTNSFKPKKYLQYVTDPLVMPRKTCCPFSSRPCRCTTTMGVQQWSPLSLFLHARSGSGSFRPGNISWLTLSPRSAHTACHSIANFAGIPN